MSRNQKAPLLAFVLVALVCGLVLVDTMRGDAEPHDQLTVLSPSQLGPAYFLAPEADPIAPEDRADESPEASGAPDSSAPSTPDRLDDDPSGSASDHATGPGPDNGESQVQGNSDDHAVDPADDDSDAVELWPPSTVPGIKSPIVAFTLFDIEDLWPGAAPTEQPTEEPTEEPTTNAGPDGVDAEPQDPGHSDGVKPSDQDEPSGSPSPSSTP